MAMENGIAIFVTTMLSCLAFQGHTCNAKEWVVGDDKGWSLDVENWPSGKNFAKGDVLGKLEVLFFLVSRW